MAGYLIEERRRWPIITASPRGKCSRLTQNLAGKACSDEGNPYQSPGRMENSSYYIAPVVDRTHDLPHTVASNMVKVSHALDHSATEAVSTTAAVNRHRISTESLDNLEPRELLENIEKVQYPKNSYNINIS